MKKTIAMMIAVMMILTATALGAPNLDRLGIVRGEGLEPITGEWSAMGYYNAETDSVNEIYLDVLILEFEGSDVFAGVYTENGGVRYQETVNYANGYLTFAPDGVYATETFVVFPMAENMLGAYQSAEGKLFEENAPVDFYMLQPRAVVDAARNAGIAAEAEPGVYEAVVFLMGDLAESMTAEEAAQLAGYAAELEAACAEMFCVTVQEVKTFATELLIAIEELTAEEKANLKAALEELGEIIARIPEEELMAAAEFLESVFEAAGALTDEEIAELDAFFSEVADAVVHITEEDLIGMGAFVEDVFNAISELTEEDYAELAAALA